MDGVPFRRAMGKSRFYSRFATGTSIGAIHDSDGVSVPSKFVLATRGQH